ncbi:protein PLASTID TRANSCRIPTIONALLY ACTIVE 16, chloroplastic [Arachis stenosperma]|uniref:protein PLASTID TRANSCRIPTIONALLY ACTIVE 16, chloroplastic n=1 Tax=Arachis stenosperma TaxID=217475 RepID=UPI0025AB699B|nr:protein PLASTID TRANSCRIPTIONALLY ACTIVE 16, chloroplastic [Arachis stenosperma]
MAPTLTSNSSLLPHSSTRFTLPRNQRLRVLAKSNNNGPFPSLRLGKPKDNDDNDGEEASSNSNPFRFNFGKLPDVTSLIPVVNNPSSSSSPGLSFGNPRRKDPSTVFVAGATGQAGIRISQTLLREGFSVRAGVPELGAAQELARLAAQYKIISKEEAKRLNAVQSSFDDADSIAKAIGNASKVVVTIGPTENGPTAEVSTADALQVVQAAQLAGVGHVAVIYDDNNATTTSTYNVLDGITSFFNNIFSKNQPLSIQEFLQKVIETDVKYTFIKTSLTDDFSPEGSYNVVVLGEGSASASDYKVAKSKIASLVADVFSNTEVAENKVVQVYTSPEAPLKRVDELFSTIPEDGRRKAYAEVLEKAKAEEEARLAAEKAQEAAEATKKLEEEVKKLSQQEARAASLAQEAQDKAVAAGASVEGLFSKAKDFGAGLSWQKFSSQISASIQNAGEDEEPNIKLATVRGQAKARSLTPNKAVVKQTSTRNITTKPKEEKPKQAEKPTEVRKVFGGLFKQETIYVDDD